MLPSCCAAAQRPIAAEVGPEAIGDATRAHQELKREGNDADAAYAAYWLANAHYQLDNPAEARAIGHQILADVRAG